MAGETKEQLVHIKADSLELEGVLVIPPKPQGIVVFVHGSGSSRHSPRNKFVAQVLQKEGFATLLFDLLTEKEDENYETRFDIDLLTRRLMAATKWVRAQPHLKILKIDYFGASTGAAAALFAAADLGNEICAIVSRGGRPDLALQVLGKVKAPTLLIVGGRDEQVIELNGKALKELKRDKKLEIIPGATHLFEEPGALEKVARLAVNWFKKYLT
jgi:pimeloyl-ACP methyl ester carboxylesterase